MWPGRTEPSFSRASSTAVLPLSFLPTRHVRPSTVNHSESRADLKFRMRTAASFMRT